jgi:tetratricopeptide (TPR) repeat protein
MTHTDSHGHPLSGATAAAVDAFEQASHLTRCLIGDPVAAVTQAIEDAPAMPMAHVLKAYLFLLGTEAPALPAAREAAAAAMALGGDERERAHAGAAGALAAGRWREAGRRLEDLSARWPTDPLALQLGHQIDFFTGDARMLRDRIARALPAWQPGMPGHHAVLGMHAFGLEETGDYAAAEAQGKRAVELQPRDGWAWHAVAHVMEMQRRERDGIAWLQPNAGTWSHESFLGVHNWWHLALFHLELDDVDAALALYDASIGGPASGIVLELIDCSALLWRLQLRGVEGLGARWSSVAERWAPHAASGNYGFNDLHAMMAFVGADRRELQRQVLEAQAEAMQRGGDNADFTREVAAPATRAVLAFGDGDYAQAAALLRPIRSYAHRFGGSHAQRDIIDQTLIEAALRGGDKALATALTRERLAARPTSAPARRLVERAAA